MQGPQEHRGPVKPDAPAEDRQHKSGTDDLPPEIGLRRVRRLARNHDVLRPRGTGVRCDGSGELAEIGLGRHGTRRNRTRSSYDEPMPSRAPRFGLVAERVLTFLAWQANTERAF